MPFSAQFRPIREAIREAAARVDFACVWADELYKTGKITQHIENEIRSADICICDLTSKNPNVAWEYGYSQALNKKVILLSQNKEDLFFDVQNDSSVIYDPGELTWFIQELTIWLNRAKNSLKIVTPEMLIGTNRHERMKLVAAATNISEAPYGIFELMDMADEHIFIAGQNLGFLHQTEKNKKTFIDCLNRFLNKTQKGQIDIMICDENCKHAIKTWEYATNVKEYLDHLKRAVSFFREVKASINDEFKQRVAIKQFEFVPTSAFFIDPESERGLGVLVPNVYQGINNAKPCFIFSEKENKNILHNYWSTYYHWFTAKSSIDIDKFATEKTEKANSPLSQQSNFKPGNNKKSVNSTKTVINNHIYGSNNPINLAVGENVSQKDILFSIAPYLEELEKLGVSKDELKELEEIVGEKKDKNPDLKSKVQKWLESIGTSIVARGIYDHFPLISEITQRLF